MDKKRTVGVLMLPIGRDKFSYLDGLRGVAALMVVFSHYAFGFYPALHTGMNKDVHNAFELLVSSSPLNVMYNGSFAVLIFFTLSGFVLSYKYWNSENISFLEYSGTMIKRYFRLNIPIIFSIIVAFFILDLGIFYNKNASEITKSVWLQGIFNFHPDFLKAIQEAFYGVIFLGKQDYNGILWTMQYEFFGSIMIYSFMFLIAKHRLRYAMYPVLFIIFWNSYFLSFFIGLLLSDLYTHNRLIIKNRFVLFLMFLVALFTGSFPWREQYGEHTHLYGLLKFDFLKVDSFYVFYHIVGAFFLLLCVINSQVLKKFLSSPTCSFLGKISFSLYLIHLSIICSFSSYFMNMLTKYLNYNLSFVIMFIFSIALLLSISYLSFKYIDQLGIRVAQKFYELFTTSRTLKKKISPPRAFFF